MERAVYCDHMDGYYGNGMGYYMTTVTAPERWSGRNKLVLLWRKVKMEIQTNLICNDHQ